MNNENLQFGDIIRINGNDNSNDLVGQEVIYLGGYKSDSIMLCSKPTGDDSQPSIYYCDTTLDYEYKRRYLASARSIGFEIGNTETVKVEPAITMAEVEVMERLKKVFTTN